jgi:hypothetical protein
MKQPHIDMEDIVNNLTRALSSNLLSDITDPVLTTLSTWNTALRILSSCAKILTLSSLI